MKAWRKLPPDTPIVPLLKSLKTRAERRTALVTLGEAELDPLDRAWDAWAHDGQLSPPATASGAPWSTWVIKAGRGFGKTLAGAQWITGLVADHPDTPLRFALVGATLEDARRVMVEGKSGLIEVAGQWLSDWTPILRMPGQPLDPHSGIIKALLGKLFPDFLGFKQVQMRLAFAEVEILSESFLLH